MEGIEFPNMTTSKGSNAAAGDSSVGIGHSEVQGQEGRKRALIVSISSYNTLRRLEFCQKDGEEMYKLLEVLGYEISDNNKLIGEVKSETMRNAIMKFFTDRSIKSKDTLLLYFSGHGVPDGYGDTYLATSEIDPDSPWYGGYSFEELTRIINRSLSSRIVLILDCCCSGAATISKGDENEAAKLAIASMDKKSNILKEYKLQDGEGKCLLAASLATQEAYGLKEKDHSIFTYHLLQGLRGANGDSIDNEGRVTPDSLGAYVYDKVTRSSPKQRPLIKTESSGKITLAEYPRYATRPSPSTPYKRVVDTSSLIDEGQLAVENEDYENAIKLFDKAIILNPNDHTPYNRKGDVYYNNLKDYQKAIEAYDGAISANPTNPFAYNSKGDVLFQLPKYQQALECYDKALKINPRYLEVLKDKGLVLDKLQKFDEAIECFDRALEIKPNHNEILRCKELTINNFAEYELNRGISVYNLGKYDESIECFRAYAKSPPAL